MHPDGSFMCLVKTRMRRKKLEKFDEGFFFFLLLREKLKSEKEFNVIWWGQGTPFKIFPSLLNHFWGLRNRRTPGFTIIIFPL